MAGLFGWIGSLWKGRDEHPPEAGDLVMTTSFESGERAEQAMPGTADLAPILTLTPPPIHPETAIRRAGGRLEEPDPVAECSVTFVSDGPFRPAALRETMTRPWRAEVLKPSVHVVAADGRTFWEGARDVPDEAAELKVAWPMSETFGLTPVQVVEAARRVGEMLAARPDGLRPREPLDAARAETQFARARRIIEVVPEAVDIVARPSRQGDRFDGKVVWNTLHAMGFKWGDMDCFHWKDPTNQADDLISVLPDDGHYGYALPEEIAAGRQHFRALRFGFSPARSPAPEHVLAEMRRATEFFRDETGCVLDYEVDGKAAAGPEVLEAAVARLVEEFAALGVTPGSTAVCRLR